MREAEVHLVDHGCECVATAGIRLRSVLSAGLFHDLLAEGDGIARGSIKEWCRQRWILLAHTFAASVGHPSCLMFLGRQAGHTGEADQVTCCFVALERQRNRQQALAKVGRRLTSLWTMLTTTLDYAEFEPMPGEAVEQLLGWTRKHHVLEVKRRHAPIQVSHGVITTPVFFGFQVDAATPSPADGSIRLMHLFPWRFGGDSWHRLLEAMVQESHPVMLVAHLQACRRPSAQGRMEALERHAQVERLCQEQVDEPVRTLLRGQLDYLRQECLSRAAEMNGALLAARLFLIGDERPSSALLAVLESSLDDPSPPADQTGALPFHGAGCAIAKADGPSILEPLHDPPVECLFSPHEAACFFRTPSPSEQEFPAGLQVQRSRTAAITGTTGHDAPLGLNIHRGRRASVALDEAMRFRHTYIVGQTGTGKSTLLLQMILHDIHAGRGVCVMDPHGSLIQKVLEGYPAERREDLMIIDPSDDQWPVPFNPLCFGEIDPHRHRLARDLFIDDMNAFVRRLYRGTPDAFGPMFEKYFRLMFGMILGSSPPPADQVPSLMLCIPFFTSGKFRKALAGRIDSEDFVLQFMLKEAEAARGDATIESVAPYITSKVTRFISDVRLRNITCQPRVIDFDELIGSGRVLLFNLGKGRIGEDAASLLASQMMSRLWAAALKRGPGADRCPFYLYADEFQLLADERLAEVLAEGRKYRLSLTVAHQFAGQLPAAVLGAVLGNVGTSVVFRVGADDASMFAAQFRPMLHPVDLVSQANFRAYVRSFGSLGSTPFSIEVPKATPSSPDQEQWARELTEAAQARYGQPRKQVEQEIRQAFEQYMQM